MRLFPVLVCLAATQLSAAGGLLDGLTQPQEGRSRRATSTMRQGEIRRGSADRHLDPRAEPKGDREEASNWDNYRVAPGEPHVLLDEEGSGTITHIWITFLGPEPQDWAKQGSANHQEMLLRMFWDGRPEPAVGAPLGDFFANCFGERNEVVSLPVVVEDADSYNCFWSMPFRKSARIEIVNQSDKPIGVKIGEPLDFYRPELKRREFHLLDFWPEPGDYVLRFECVGRNPASQGVYLGLESVRLRERRPPVAEWGFDRDRDWRTDPVLYE